MLRKMMLAIVAVAGLCTASAQDEIEGTVGMDVVSRYVWRGQPLGDAAVQPTATLSYKGLSLTAWSSFGFINKKDAKEFDLTLAYTIGGFNIGVTDYWFNAGLDPEKAPKIFNVNWFRKDENDEFIWPGFGDNLRVLDWIIDRCEGKVDAQETPIGYLPFAKDINREGLDISVETLDSILDVDKEAWEEEFKGVDELYAKFGDRLPKELADELASVRKAFEN